MAELTKCRLTLEELKRHVGNEVAGVLGLSTVELRLEELGSVSRNDGPAAYRVSGRSGGALAVLLCSARSYPEMVQRGMSRASNARDALAPQQARAILMPLLEGRVENCTFALLRYCSPLTARRPLRWLQRALLAPRLLEWLFQVGASTLSDVDNSLVESSFGEPLQRLASLEGLAPSVRDSATLALRRLRDGAWQPRYVLMHGDFWMGNVLIHPIDSHGHVAWADRFIVIDWAGSELKGYPFYDLVRFAMSVGMTPRALRAEVVRHCQALGVDFRDAMSSLLGALGHVALHLECFPMDQYLRMAHACHTSMTRAAP